MYTSCPASCCSTGSAPRLNVPHVFLLLRTSRTRNNLLLLLHRRNSNWAWSPCVKTADDDKDSSLILVVNTSNILPHLIFFLFIVYLSFTSINHILFVSSQFHKVCLIDLNKVQHPLFYTLHKSPTTEKTLLTVEQTSESRVRIPVPGQVRQILRVTEHINKITAFTTLIRRNKQTVFIRSIDFISTHFIPSSANVLVLPISHDH